MKIVFLTRSLQSGGAERQLAGLARGLAERGHGVTIAQFYNGGQLERDLDDTGVRLVDMNKQGRWSNFAFLLRLYNLVSKEKPDIFHSYLDIANICSLLIGKMFPSTKIVWGIRSSDMDLTRYDTVARLSYRVECKLSRWANLIIANSEAGRRHAVKNGFPAAKIRVIYNGIDTVRFAPDRDSGIRLRQQWKVASKERLVGIVARIDPMKDHETFLRAAKQVYQEIRHCRFVCVGRADATALAGLKELASDLKIGKALIWAGERDDLPAVYNALDVLCQSSITEGFPNAIAEAMACGVPCVATDVGDTAFIMGNTGRIVSPRQPERLAEAMIDLLRGDQTLPSDTARERIVGLLSSFQLIEATEQELLALINKDLH
jgi:glycosyltransferase involved in cell wall biosynthesis